MRLGKKRRVLAEVLARLLGWQTAPGQAGRLAVRKELCWLVDSRGVSCRPSSRYTNVTVHNALQQPALCSYVRCHSCSTGFSFSLYLRPLFFLLSPPRILIRLCEAQALKAGRPLGAQLYLFIADQSVGFSAASSQQTANVQLARAEKGDSSQVRARGAW